MFKWPEKPVGAFKLKRGTRVPLEDKSISTAFLEANATFSRYCDFLVHKGFMEAEQAVRAKAYYETVREEEPLKGYRQLVLDELCEKFSG